MNKRMKAWPVLALLLVCGGHALQATGLTWPGTQFFPTFSTPAATIDCIDVDGLPSDEEACFSSLEGIVNRTQPRVACVSAASEGEFTWMNIHGLSHDTITGFAAIQKYETNVTGLVVYDTNLLDTLNLATTIAGVKNELICDSNLMVTLTNAPYYLPVKDDLRGKFSSKYQVYGYLYTNYWSQCSRRIMGGLETNQYWYLREYFVAVKSAVVWLDPNISQDAATLSLFTSSMAPMGGVYIGWWPNETADMQWISQYGIPVMASDIFDNGSVYGGVTTQINIPPIPPAPALQNKVYVSITLSDGDNVQYMQHTMYMNWQSSYRGKVPIGWTVQPLLRDFDPAMLNYFWSTATTNDCLVAGPSGAGYTRLNFWSTNNVSAYTRATSPYLERDGIRAATVWLTLSNTTANAFATNCPTLVGLDDYQDGYYTKSYNSLPAIGFPSNGNYATSVTNLVNAITNAAASWNGSSPMFISVEADAWDVNPSNCDAVASSLPGQFVVVRPDHLFLLYREAAGLGTNGAFPYLAVQPANQAVAIGANVTFSSVASGTGPLNYQWLMNSTNIPGATNSALTKSNVQTSDAGDYSVMVTSGYGSAVSGVTNGILSVGPTAPVIVSQSPLATNNLVLYTPLSVSATGSGSLYYQWFSNSVAIAGATGMEYLSSAGSQSGANNYYCVVSNLVGTATSSVWSVSFVPQSIASYAQAVLALNPIGYWPMNETPNNGSGNQGMICHDYAGGNNGVYSNAVLAQAGYDPATDPAETSVLFGSYASANSAVGQIGNIDFNTPVGSNAEFSVSAWVNGSGHAQNVNAGIVAKGYFYGEELDLDEGAPGADFRFEARSALGNSYNANSAINALNGGWYHLVGVCDEANGNLFLYINGALAAQASIPIQGGITNSSNVPLTIGARATSAATGNNQQFFGDIDDVAIYNYALSSNQVQALYQAAPVPVMNLAGSGNNLVINYTGALLSSTNVAGPYAPVTGASPPYYSIPTTNSQMFYRVNNQ